MCDPVSLLVTQVAIGVASSVTNAVDQNKQDKKNKKAANTALGIENRDISLRALQERIIAAQEAVSVNRQAAESASMTTAGAAAGNVGGMTVDLLLQDVENSRLETLDRIEQQRDTTLDALDRERSAARVRAKNRANQTSRANPAAVGLSIVRTGLDAYGGYINRQPPVTPGD